MAGELPSEVRLVRDFVNTFDVEDAADRLASKESAAEWLQDHGLIGSTDEVRAQDLRLLREARESLRAVLRAHHGEELDADVIEGFNRAAGASRLTVSFDADGTPRLQPAATGARAALAQILTGVVVAHETGTWERLKVCPEETCQWAFYDESKNASRRWCSMKVCGNRTKTRAYRERRRG